MPLLRTCPPACQRPKHFCVHKCVNDNCSYYKRNLKKLLKDFPPSEYWKYKLRYLYREFSVNFFDMGLCLSYRVNLKLSLRQTVQALKEIHGIEISHTMVNNYAKTAAVLIRPFLDFYDYKPSNALAADETYIKIRGVKAYIWLIMDKVSCSILGYQVSCSKDVGPCILTMRMAFDKFKEFPGKSLKFIADGSSVYPLAAQQFKLEKDWDVFITQVIGLTNGDEVSKKFRPFKQFIERLNRIFKESYRVICGYGTQDGACHSVSLWVAYYNFLRPHEITGGKEPSTKSSCWKVQGICLASGSCSSISDNKQSCSSKRRKPRTVLRFRARDKYPATGTTGSGCVLDGTAKQCYNAVDLTETNGLFLSSSPSIRYPEHCFVMPSRVAYGTPKRTYLRFSRF